MKLNFNQEDFMHKQLKAFFKIFIAIMFFWQSTVVAQTPQSAAKISFNDVLVEQYVKDLNSGIKYKDIYGKFNVKSPQDKALVKNILDQHGEAFLPVPKVNANVLTFNYEKTKVDIEFIDFLNEKLKINGYEADLKKFTTLTEKIEYTKRILKKTKTQASLQFKNPLLILLYPNQAEAELITLIVLISCVAANAVAWGWSYKQMHPNNKPFINLAENIMDQVKRCIEKQDLETLTAQIESEFSCKKDVFTVKVNGQECYSREKEPKSSLTLAMKKCCSEDVENCESTFKSSFPKAEKSKIERTPDKKGNTYRANEQ